MEERIAQLFVSISTRLRDVLDRNLLSLTLSMHSGITSFMAALVATETSFFTEMDEPYEDTEQMDIHNIPLQPDTLHQEVRTPGTWGRTVHISPVHMRKCRN